VTTQAATDVATTSTASTCAFISTPLTNTSLGVDPAGVNCPGLSRKELLSEPPSAVGSEHRDGVWPSDRIEVRVANPRRIVLMLVFGGVAAFLLPYVLPQDAPPRMQPAILATILFGAAFVLAYGIDRLLPRRTSKLG